MILAQESSGSSIPTYAAHDRLYLNIPQGGGVEMEWSSLQFPGILFNLIHNMDHSA